MEFGIAARLAFVTTALAVILSSNAAHTSGEKAKPRLIIAAGD